MVKPSKVFISDCVELRKNQVNFTFEIIAIPKNRIEAKLLDIHRKTLPQEAFKALELLKYSKDYYRKKEWEDHKDRRDIRILMIITLIIKFFLKQYYI